MINRKIDETTRYFPCAPSHGFFDPAQRKVKHMLHLVAYDIANPKRLRLIAKTCEDFGIRVEHSVFECDLSPDRFKMMWNELNQLINPKEDALLAYNICTKCLKKSQAAGNIERPEKTNLFIL